ncbi:MAG: hypothetical protein QM535_20760 [Limnohabitans sp.]|nr:hypothetical protein [Limnohabitans sp.]
MHKQIVILSLFSNLFIFGLYNNSFRLKKDTQNSVEEILLNTTWETNSILGLNPKDKIYTLKKFKERKFVGCLVDFYKNNQFYSRNVSFCGVDYLTNVSGEYKILNNDIIKIKVEKITYSGEKKKILKL